MKSSKIFVPEIHDIHGGNARALAPLLDLLPGGAGDCAAILVVPFFQERHSLDKAPDLARSLREHPGEIVLHGLTHVKPQSLGNRILFGGANHAEFAGLSRSRAEERIRKGVEIFTRAVGKPPQWFCAPRWILSRGGKKAAFDQGLAAIMALGGYARRGRPVVRIPAVSFDHGDRPLVIRAQEKIRGRLFRRLFARKTPFRLVLHPADLERKQSLLEIRRWINALEADGWKAARPEEALLP